MKKKKKGISLDFGHYYSFGRKGFDNNSPWIEFNDSEVSCSSFSHIKSLTDNFKTDVAYILFYTQEETRENILDFPFSLKQEVHLSDEKYYKEGKNMGNMDRTRNYNINRNNDKDGNNGGNNWIF